MDLGFRLGTVWKWVGTHELSFVIPSLFMRWIYFSASMKVDQLNWIVNMDDVQRTGDLGILSSRGIASHSSGNKKEIFSTPCVLWHHWDDARYNYGDKCLWKRARRTPDEAIRSPKLLIWWFSYLREWGWVVLISGMYGYVSRNLECSIWLTERFGYSCFEQLLSRVTLYCIRVLYKKLLLVSEEHSFSFSKTVSGSI